MQQREGKFLLTYHLSLLRFAQFLSGQGPVTTSRTALLPIALLAAAFFCAVSTGLASDSLYNPSNAQSISGNALIHFGPKAGNFRYDKRMIHAAEIAEQRAHTHSHRRCWHYVKEALVDAQVVNKYPGTANAKQAGDELIKNHGFKKLAIRDPFAAPLGAVLVYGGRGAGHVEIRSLHGFVSDFESPKPSSRPLIGVYVKPS